MKTSLVVTLLFLIAWLNSGCASFGYLEIENVIPAEEGKVRSFVAPEFSYGISNELFFRKYISDTVQYDRNKVFKQSPPLCLMIHAGAVVGITNSDALSIRIRTVVFPKSVGINLGYRRLLSSSSSNFLTGYLNIGYTNVFDYIFYNGGITNDEDGSMIRLFSDAIHYKGGVVLTHQNFNSEGNISKIYLGGSLQFNHASTEVRGGISYFRFASSNYDYKILDKQKHNWLTFIPYGGFTLGSRHNSVLEFAFPFWYDSLLRRWVITPALGVGYSVF